MYRNLLQLMRLLCIDWMSKLVNVLRYCSTGIEDLCEELV